MIANITSQADQSIRTMRQQEQNNPLIEAIRESELVPDTPKTILSERIRDYSEDITTLLKTLADEVHNKVSETPGIETSAFEQALLLWQNSTDASGESVTHHEIDEIAIDGLMSMMNVLTY